MIIDGTVLADEILARLKKQVQVLIKKGVTPTLAVILVGNDVNSESYVRMKQKAAERIGAKLMIIPYDTLVEKNTLQQKIRELNADHSIHGIIIQRPLPANLRDSTLLNSIDPKKDIDGMVLGTHFKVPVALAIYAILEKIFDIGTMSRRDVCSSYKPGEFESWVQNQHIVLIGKGETAGGPICEFLGEKHCATSVIDSKTSPDERKKLLQNGTVVISCVGKEGMIQAEDIKKGAVLLAVGISRKDAKKKLHGDYKETDIRDIASFYTTTPGAVGPVNVAHLMQNLVKAASMSLQT